jgi:hypothetical protein
MGINRMLTPIKLKGIRLGRVIPCALYVLIALLCIQSERVMGSEPPSEEFGGLSPEGFASLVHVGPDTETPIGSHYLMTINPRRHPSGQFVVPKTIPEALRALSEMLPHWYKGSMLKVDADKCKDRDPLWLSVFYWTWINWRLNEADSLLRLALDDVGIRGEPLARAALYRGLRVLLLARVVKKAAPHDSGMPIHKRS